MELPGIFQRYRVQIDQELREILAELQSPLYTMLHYQLGWADEQGEPVNRPAGKALRPTLCLLTYESYCGDFKKALPAAAAIELVHNFSLIHDDIQDNDRLRRNHPTVWTIWGKPQAINAGTVTRVLANLSLIRLQQNGLSETQTLKALRLLDESSLSLIEGQYMDISFEERTDIGVQEYLNMAAGKTANLIACALQMGALLANQSEDTIRAFQRIGRHVGLAFQIKDDILGIWGADKITGKPVGGDIRRKKKSYPIAYAWDQTDPSTRQALLEIYRQPEIDERSCQVVLDILARTGAHEHAQALVDSYSTQALNDIVSMVPNAWGRDQFTEVVSFLTKRAY